MKEFVPPPINVGEKHEEQHNLIFIKISESESVRLRLFVRDFEYCYTTKCVRSEKMADTITIGHLRNSPSYLMPPLKNAPPGIFKGNTRSL